MDAISKDSVNLVSYVSIADVTGEVKEAGVN